MVAMSQVTKQLRTLVPLIACVGCGPGSVEEYDAFPCLNAGTLCVTLEIPKNYSGTPRKLSTGFYDTSDTARIPNEQLPTIDYPTIVAGEDYALSFKDMDFTGDYFLMFILFDEDGGTYIPKVDIDYTATTSDAISIDGGPIEIGSMKMKLKRAD